jgi:hypothetical protein
MSFRILLSPPGVGVDVAEATEVVRELERR